MHRGEASTTSFVDLSAISNADAKEMTQHRKQDTEDARCALSQETENHRIALLQQRVTFEEQLDIEKRKTDRELAASWVANEELKELVKKINTSERYMSTPHETPSGGANHAVWKPLAGAEKQDEASETDLQVKTGESDFGVRKCTVAATRVIDCSKVLK